MRAILKTANVEVEELLSTKMTPLNYIDLFAGIGGFRLGVIKINPAELF